MDFIGKGVMAYHKLIIEYDIITKSVIKYMTGFSKTNKVFKRWIYQQDTFVSKNRDLRKDHTVLKIPIHNSILIFNKRWLL